MSRGTIRPLFAGADVRELEVARELLGIYGGQVGRRKGEIRDKVQEVEERAEVDYRLVRGLALLLERRCVFEADTVLDPVRARTLVFERASRRRIVTLEQREQVLKEASEVLGTTPEELERSMYSDLEEELVLRSFEPLEPEKLLRYYNLSLLQTLLFKAMRMEFTATGNWKSIFHQIKRLGLMYSVEKRETEGAGKEVYVTSVDGPLSLFRMTDRYGTSLAKLLPQVVASEEWSVKADILARNKGRIYSFEIDSGSVKGMIQDVVPEGLAMQPLYDSSLEERFARSFEAMRTGWTLRREPEPLVAGSHVLIPDFSFEKDGSKVYLEVVGFWTEEYLSRKLAKLSSLASSVDMLVAVDESLACSKLSKLKPQSVIYFSKEVPVGPVVSHLKKYEEEAVKTEVRSLNGEIRLTKDIVRLQEIATEHGVSKEAARRAIQSRTFEGYSLVGETFLSDRILKELDRKVSASEKLSDAIKVIESYGIDDPYPVLSRLGFRVVWAGLDVDRSRVERLAR